MNRPSRKAMGLQASPSRVSSDARSRYARIVSGMRGQVDNVMTDVEAEVGMVGAWGKTAAGISRAGDPG